MADVTTCMSITRKTCCLKVLPYHISSTLGEERVDGSFAICLRWTIQSSSSMIVVEVVEVVHPSMNWFVESYYRKSPEVESPDAQRGQSEKKIGQKRNI